MILGDGVSGSFIKVKRKPRPFAVKRESDYERMYIGIPKTVMTDYADRIEVVSGNYELCEGVYLIPHNSPQLEEIGKFEHMYQKQGRKMVPDNFSHEQSLVLDTYKGLVIINCCSHGGTANIIREVQEAFPDKHIHGMIGEFHLFNKDDSFIRGVAKGLIDSEVDFICTGHCTGKRAFAILQAELGANRVQQLKVGKEMYF